MTTHSDNFVDITGSTPRITLVDQDSSQPDYRFINGGNNLKLRFGVPSIGTGWTDGTEIAAFDRDNAITLRTNRINLRFGEFDSGTFEIVNNQVSSTAVVRIDGDSRIELYPRSFFLNVNSGEKIELAGGDVEVSGHMEVDGNLFVGQAGTTSTISCQWHLAGVDQIALQPESGDTPDPAVLSLEDVGTPPAKPKYSA